MDEDTADTFSFDVCTLRALERRFDIERRPLWARGTLVVGTFSWEAVDAVLNQLYARFQARTGTRSLRN